MALGTACALLFAIDGMLEIFVHHETTQSVFIDNKESKFLHYEQQAFGRRPDAVFIGSSLTKNHISTGDFREKGWQIYNLGISGRLLADYPSMAEAALRKAPRLVVLNVSVADLVTPPHSDFMHLPDLKAAWRSGQPTMAFLESAGNFLLNKHSMHYYREPIYARIAGVLQKAAPSNAENRTPAYADQIEQRPDCDVFKRDAYKNMVVITCSNGDGIQLGRFDPSRDIQPGVPANSALNEESVRLLNEVVNMINSRSRTVVVLQPAWRGTPDINLAEVRSRIAAPVVDLRAVTFTEDDWADGGHFNLFGRRKYTARLEHELRPYLGRD
ncbi:MAG: hypothetical protein ACXVCK_02410 [Bdellovibrionota bacterium]